MSVVEIRPQEPELGSLKVVPDPRPRLARCRLVVDRRAGTATWQGEKAGGKPVELRLGDAPGELAEIVRVVYPSAVPNAVDVTLVGRVLLVDCTGRVLVRTEQQPQVVFEQAWPFSVQDAGGLPVREQRFRNTRLLQKAHPGAARLWPLSAGVGWFMLTVGGAVALLVALLVALVAVIVSVLG